MEAHPAEGVAQLVLQIALVLAAARFGGEIAERWLRQPAVLGEVVAGITIGPFALGALEVPRLGPLFPAIEGPVAVSPELFALSQLGSIVLLFVAGLETDLRTFLRYGPNAALVAIGGVVLPFALGAAGAVAVGFADGVGDPPALFMGAILTATSIGITARVLGDLGKLDTPEGVTILGAAVIDDVLGIVILAVVIAAGTGDGSSAGALGWLAVQAVAAWLILSAGFALIASLISRVALALRVQGAGLAIALAAGLIGAYLADLAGLALIIGAYSAGLALSTTRLKEHLEHEIRVVYDVFVPIFFVVTGMLVDLSALGAAIGVGLLLTLLAAIGKVVGCGLPALVAGFNARGALRIGVGMLPRGEVALVVAGAGLAAGIISQQVFAAAIFVAVATTIAAPPLLGPSFRSPASGVRRPVDRDVGEIAETEGARIDERHEWTLSHAAAALLSRSLRGYLVESGFKALTDLEAPHEQVAQYRRAGVIVSIEVRDRGDGHGTLRLEAEGDHVDGVLDAALAVARSRAIDELSGTDDRSPDRPAP